MRDDRYSCTHSLNWSVAWSLQFLVLMYVCMLCSRLNLPAMRSWSIMMEARNCTSIPFRSKVLINVSWHYQLQSSWAILALYASRLCFATHSTRNECRSLETMKLIPHLQTWTESARVRCVHTENQAWVRYCSSLHTHTKTLWPNTFVQPWQCCRSGPDASVLQVRQHETSHSDATACPKQSLRSQLCFHLPCLG